MNFRAGPASAGRGVVTAAGGSGRSLYSPSDRPARNSTPSPRRVERARDSFAISCTRDRFIRSLRLVSRLSMLAGVRALGSEIGCPMTDDRCPPSCSGAADSAEARGAGTRYRANRSKPRTRLLDNDATTARRAFPTIERSLAGLFWVCVKEPRLTFYQV